MQNDRRHIISYHDENAICAPLRADHHAPLAFELETGLRGGDIVGLRWREVNLAAKTVCRATQELSQPKVPRRSQTSRPRNLETDADRNGGRFGDLVFTRVETMTEPHGHVPTSTTVSTSIGSGRLLRTLKKAFDDAGLGRLVFRDIRRTAGARYNTATKNYEKNCIFLGHSVSLNAA